MWSQSQHLNTVDFSYLKRKITCMSPAWVWQKELIGSLPVSLAQLFLPAKSGKTATKMLDFSKLQDKWRTEEFSFKKEEPKHNLFGVRIDVKAISINISTLYKVSVFKIQVSISRKTICIRKRWFFSNTLMGVWKCVSFWLEWHCLYSFLEQVKSVLTHAVQMGQNVINLRDNFIINNEKYII